MQLRLEFDLTPQEARKLMGLPNVEAFQQKLVEETYKKLSEGLNEMKDPEKLFREFVPMGAQGLDQFQKVVAGLASLANRAGVRGDNEEEEEK